MRKIYAILALLAFVNGSFGQSTRLKKTTMTQSRKESITPYVWDNMFDQPYQSKKNKNKPNYTISPTSKSMWLWEQVIGYTTYDNQANNSMQQRVITDASEQVHATWTMSLQLNTTQWGDRGTGYNMGAGYVWGQEPYERVESTRSGWPGLVKLSTGEEAFFSHNDDGAITMIKRPLTGSGDWTSTTVPSTLTNKFRWSRAVADGNTIHLIALSEPTGLDGTKVNGIDGNLAYWRSLDNGASWDIQSQIFSLIDSTEYSFIESDAYAMDARNGQVSIAVFNEIHDGLLLNSTNNGTDWTSTIFMDFPIPAYQSDQITDIENDGIIDTMVTNDGTGAVLIDSNGITHLSFGQYAFYDDIHGDTLYSVFLSEDLLYWNSTMATDEIYVVGTVQENPNDLNTTFDIVVAESPDYRCSLASMPTMAEDGDGNLYIVFSAADEEYLGDQVFRHLFVTTSSDSGTNWAPQVELTPDLDVNEYEYVFPSMANRVNETLHIVVQRDNEPGLIVRGDKDDSVENDIVYLAVTRDLDITIDTKEVSPAVAGSLNVYPNPTHGVVTVSGDNLSNAALKVYNSLGQELLNTKLGKNFNANDKQVFDFSYLPEGKYTIVVGSGKNKLTKEIIIQK